MIVVDTNLIVALLVAGPDGELAQAVLARDPRWAAPPLWRSELRNVLALAVRRSGLALAAAETYCARARELLEGRERPVEDASVLRRASASGCTACDCEFVALAERLGVPLVTSDQQVLAAGPGRAGRIANGPRVGTGPRRGTFVHPLRDPSRGRTRLADSRREPPHAIDAPAPERSEPPRPAGMPRAGVSSGCATRTHLGVGVQPRLSPPPSSTWPPGEGYP